MTTLLRNHSDLDLIIEELKRPRENDELGIDELITKLTKNLTTMINYGWPYQDILEDKDGPAGIPVTLAEIVVEVCRFCADHNIDLTDAIGLTFSR